MTWIFTRVICDVFLFFLFTQGRRFFALNLGLSSIKKLVRGRDDAFLDKIPSLACA